VSERAYDGMSHDEILRVHAERYAKLSPEEKALQSEERAKAEREKLLAEAQRLSQPLSELTLGDSLAPLKRH